MEDHAQFAAQGVTLLRLGRVGRAEIDGQTQVVPELPFMHRTVCHVCLGTCWLDTNCRRLGSSSGCEDREMIYPKPSRARGLPAAGHGRGYDAAAKKGPMLTVKDKQTAPERRLGGGAPSEGFELAPASGARASCEAVVPTVEKIERLRWDHTELRPTKRGSKAVAEATARSPKRLKKAVVELKRDIHAATTVACAQGKLELWDRLARLAGHQASPSAEPGVAPFTEKLITDVLASLKKAGYRSAPSYANLAKLRARRQGVEVSPTIELLCTDEGRSTQRGIGPAKQCPGFPVEGLGNLPTDPTTKEGKPLHPDGPAHPRRCTNVSAFLFCREIEASALRRCHVLEAVPRSHAVVRMGTSPTKTDIKGEGVPILFECLCGQPKPERGALACPACDICTQLMVPGNGEDPLFPTRDGKAATKDGMTATWQMIGILNGVPEKIARQMTGHAARVAMAMCMAGYGISDETICKMARWGSNAVLKYTRLAHTWSLGGMGAQLARRIADRAFSLPANRAAWGTNWQTGAPQIRGGGCSTTGQCSITWTPETQETDAGTDEVIVAEAEPQDEPAPQVDQHPEEHDDRVWCATCHLEIAEGAPREHCSECWRPMHNQRLDPNDAAGAQLRCPLSCAKREWSVQHGRYMVGCEGEFCRRCVTEHNCRTHHHINRRPTSLAEIYLPGSNMMAVRDGNPNVYWGAAIPVLRRAPPGDPHSEAADRARPEADAELETMAGGAPPPDPGSGPAGRLAAAKNVPLERSTSPESEATAALQTPGCFGPWLLPQGSTAEDLLGGTALDQLDQRKPGDDPWGQATLAHMERETARILAEGPLASEAGGQGRELVARENLAAAPGWAVGEASGSSSGEGEGEVFDYSAKVAPDSAAAADLPSQASDDKLTGVWKPPKNSRRPTLRNAPRRVRGWQDISPDILLVNTSTWVAHALVAASFTDRAATSADMVAEAGRGAWQPRGACGFSPGPEATMFVPAGQAAGCGRCHGRCGGFLATLAPETEDIWPDAGIVHHVWARRTEPPPTPSSGESDDDSSQCSSS